MRQLPTIFFASLLAITSSRAGGQFGGNMMMVAGNKPLAPTALAAAGSSAAQIDLTWTDNSNNESGFSIDRSPDGVSGWVTIGSVGANVTAYSDTTLTENTTEYYRVYANSVDGPSLYSSVANAASRLNAPTALSPAVASASQINLSWADNSSFETGYQVERSLDNATWTVIATTAANATTNASTGLAGCTTYYYRIKAVSAGNTSTYTGSVNGLTQANSGSATFNSSSSWTVPGCIVSVTIQIWGGGGAGGSATLANGAGGGGGGGYASKVLGVTPGQVIGFTVGGGGANAHGGGSNGPGGTTSCSAMTANGGGGGGDTSGGGGGSGGGAGGGSTNSSGGGGASAGGGGGGGSSGSGSTSPGGGGSGGGNCFCDGGNGASGQVTFTY